MFSTNLPNYGFRLSPGWITRFERGAGCEYSQLRMVADFCPCCPAIQVELVRHKVRTTLSGFVSTPTRAIYDGVPILLVRRGQRIFAMAETCSHFSGPLSEGKLVENSIVCPYHASRFALDDGRVINGPAVHPQPCLQVRVRNGQIEVRKSQSEKRDAQE